MGSAWTVSTLSPPQLSAYLARIRYDGPQPLRPTLPVLAALHRCHGAAIPYELLDWFVGVPQGGRRISAKDAIPVSYDMDLIYDTLVTRKRGGACVYHNLLFAAALKAIGFHAIESWAAIGQLEARLAKHAPGDPLPYEGHMVLAVQCDCRPYLCDLGSPADGLVQPIRIDLDLVQPVNAYTAFALRTLPEDARYTELRVLRNAKWTRVLAFRRGVQQTGDAILQPSLAALDVIPLMSSLIIARQHPEGADTLVDRKLRQRRGYTVTNRTLNTRAEYERALHDVFEIDFNIDRLLPAARKTLAFPDDATPAPRL